MAQFRFSSVAPQLSMLLLTGVWLGCEPLATSLVPVRERDAGVPELVKTHLQEPVPAVLPEPANFLPCPQGWKEVLHLDGPTSCEPWPTNAIPLCAADEAQFPGEEGCRQVGTACTDDEWARGLPSSQVIFVRAQLRGTTASQVTVRANGLGGALKNLQLGALRSGCWRTPAATH